MKLSQTLSTIGFLALAPVFAANAHPHPSYDFISLGASSTNEDTFSDKYIGYGGIASISLTSRLFTQISYSKVQDDLIVGNNQIGSDFATFGVALGYRFPIGHATEWFIALGLSDTNGSVLVDDGLFDFTGESYSANVGYIARLSSWELSTNLFYSQGAGDTSASGLQAKVRYFMSDHFSLDLSGSANEEGDSVGLTVSYHF